MKMLLLIVIIVITSSCKTISFMPGKYYKEGGGFAYELSLSADSAFEYKEYSLGIESNAMVFGSYLNNRSLLLKCNEEKSVLSHITRGYINEREKRVTFLRHNKIKIGVRVLKRQ